MALAGPGQLLARVLEEPVQDLFNGPILDGGPGSGQFFAWGGQHLQANLAAFCAAPPGILQGEPATAQVVTGSCQASGLFADPLFQDRTAGMVAIDDLQGRLQVDETSTTDQRGT